MRELTVLDHNDDLAGLSLTQARMMAALDDMPTLPPGPPRIAIVIDATISTGEFLPRREITLEKARAYFRAMFGAGSGLQVLILYFRGKDESGDLGWFTDPEPAAQAVADLKHAPGFTQHGRAFAQILQEAHKQPIHAAVVFTDAVELHGRGNSEGDDLTDLCKTMMRLRRAGCRIAFAYKGTIPNGCPIDRAGPHAEARIRELAADNEGVVLNVTDPKFADKLREVVTEAALRAKADDSAYALLPHLRTVPFDLTAVGEKVPVGRCSSASGSAGGNDPSRTG
jgi:hypothetical protein